MKKIFIIPIIFISIFINLIRPCFATDVVVNDDIEQNQSTISVDFTEVNENLNKIDKDLQFIITYLSLLAVVILIYIVYKFFNIFFPIF